MRPGRNHSGNNSNMCLDFMSLLFKTWTICFFEHIKAVDPCQDEQILSNICESPCVAQVGLSIVRVTINNFHANSKCVETASILYWSSDKIIALISVSVWSVPPKARGSFLLPLFLRKYFFCTMYDGISVYPARQEQFSDSNWDQRLARF